MNEKPFSSSASSRHSTAEAKEKAKMSELLWPVVYLSSSDFCPILLAVAHRSIDTCSPTYSSALNMKERCEMCKLQKTQQLLASYIFIGNIYLTIFPQKKKTTELKKKTRTFAFSMSNEMRHPWRGLKTFKIHNSSTHSVFLLLMLLNFPYNNTRSLHNELPRFRLLFHFLQLIRLRFRHHRSLPCLDCVCRTE